MVIFECHGIRMLRKSPIKWRQRPDMTIAVDCDVKNQFKEIIKRLVEQPVCNFGVFKFENRLFVKNKKINRS